MATDPISILTSHKQVLVQQAQSMTNQITRFQEKIDELKTARSSLSDDIRTTQAAIDKLNKP